MNKNIYSDNQLKQLEKLEKIRKYRIHDIITRFFDLLQIGDNQVFILKKQPNIKKTN
jgi:hypothetical protein